jgi:hypothetical protein
LDLANPCRAFLSRLQQRREQPEALVSAGLRQLVAQPRAGPSGSQQAQAPHRLAPLGLLVPLQHGIEAARIAVEPVHSGQTRGNLAGRLVGIGEQQARLVLCRRLSPGQ